MVFGAQISTEMIIILAVLLALVLIVANQLQKTASITKNQSEVLSQGVFTTVNETTNLGKKSSGESCVSDGECKSGTCEITGLCR